MSGTSSKSEQRPGEEVLAMRDIFAMLLKDFSAFAPRCAPPSDAREGRIRALLERFSLARRRSDIIEAAQAAADNERLTSLLTNYGRAVVRHRQRQEESADDFNLLAVMNLTGKEIRHSMVLAWMLDHDLRRMGTHAQGNLGFRLFLRELELPAHYANEQYWVRREVAGDESIVDIEIASRGHFLIHVENKIWSSEGKDQTDREWADVQRRSAALGIDAGTNGSVHALYLTPHGTAPNNKFFRGIAWGRIVRVLEAFAIQAKPPDVRLFASHYARALQRFVVTQSITEDEHG